MEVEVRLSRLAKAIVVIAILATTIGVTAASSAPSGCKNVINEKSRIAPAGTMWTIWNNTYWCYSNWKVTYVYGEIYTYAHEPEWNTYQPNSKWVASWVNQPATMKTRASALFNNNLLKLFYDKPIVDIYVNGAGNYSLNNTNNWRS
jgi:hypothetical protein